jgi:hypothetical protein
MRSKFPDREAFLRKLFGLGVVLLALACGAAATAQTNDDQKLAAAHELLKTVDEPVLFDTRIDLIAKQGVDQFRQAYPAASDDDVAAYDRLLREELSSHSDALQEFQAQYYAQHFSLQELRDWNAFYKTELGQKIANSAPEMTRDVYGVDLLWVRTSVSKAYERYLAAKQKAVQSP